MLRPRRAKQRPVQSHEIVGLLPSEEAAIQKALMASIAKPSKTSPSQGQTTSSRKPSPKVIKHLKPIDQPRPRKYSRSTTPKFHSISPLSLTSGISFLSSSDSFSSTAWTPTPASPPAKVKGQKKPTTAKVTNAKKTSPKQTPESVTGKSSAGSSPKRKEGPKKMESKQRNRNASVSSNSGKKVNGSMKSIHKTKTTTLKAKKAKLIACAVRKKANTEEPRNEAGLTVDEILKSVASLNDGHQRSKVKSPKVKALAEKLLTPKPAKSLSSTPKTGKNSQKLSLSLKPTPKRSPIKASKTPRGKLFTKSLKLEVLPQALSMAKPKQEGPDPAPTQSEEQMDRGSSERQSPNSFSYQAQRKFASNHSPPCRPLNQSLTSPQGLKEMPKTEDFLHFLCLRGSKSIPEQYKKFELPWTPIKQAPDRNTKETNSKKVSKDKSVMVVGCGLTAKKLEFPSGIQVN